jgi:hypothetical protein
MEVGGESGSDGDFGGRESADDRGEGWEEGRVGVDVFPRAGVGVGEVAEDGAMMMNEERR